MIAKSGHFRWLLALVALGLLFCVTEPAIHAQFGDELFEEEDLFAGDDPFLEEDEFGLPQDDFTEGGEFVEEADLPPSQQLISGRQRDLRLLGEREMLPLNAAWGAGTGLVIGGWFALINQGTSRETQRSLGLGVVLGTIVGLLVGARSLVAPDSPTAVGPLPTPGSLDPSPMAMPAQPFLPLASFSMRF